MSKAELAQKLGEHDRPVIYAGGGNAGLHIWHVPQTTDGEVEPLCGRDFKSPRVTSLSLFKRRRNPRMCDTCSRWASADGYPESAPLQGETQ
jgi:hypothetical protein